MAETLAYKPGWSKRRDEAKLRNERKEDMEQIRKDRLAVVEKARAAQTANNPEDIPKFLPERREVLTEEQRVADLRSTDGQSVVGQAEYRELRSGERSMDEPYEPQNEADQNLIKESQDKAKTRSEELNAKVRGKNPDDDALLEE